MRNTAFKNIKKTDMIETAISFSHIYKSNADVSYICKISSLNSKVRNYTDNKGKAFKTTAVSRKELKLQPVLSQNSYLDQRCLTYSIKYTFNNDVLQTAT